MHFSLRCRAVGEIYDKFEFEACYVSLLFYSKPRVNQEQHIIVHQIVNQEMSVNLLV